MDPRYRMLNDGTVILSPAEWLAEIPPEPTEAEREIEYAATRTPEDQLDLLAELRARKLEIERPFQEQINILAAQMQIASAEIVLELASLESHIKTAALERGKSIKGHGLQAVYSQGRVSWDDKCLSGYAVDHPAILSWRKAGEPSVSIREVK